MDVRPEVVSALRFIEDHSADQITLDDVADAVAYSRFHLAREFSAAVGMGPITYLATRRFRHAKELLLSTDEKVVDICMEVGFSSLGTFSRRFVEAVGVTPAAFRSLPDVLTDAPPTQRHLPGGDRRGGRVEARLRWTETALAASTGWVYAGLFGQRAARGRPVCGSLFRQAEAVVFEDVPPGQWWLLAAVFTSDDVVEQLLPRRPTTGGAAEPIRVAAGQTTSTTIAMVAPERWETPITVALPALTSSADPAPQRPLRPLPRVMRVLPKENP
ncbi:hypothetical protein GCM10027418_31330 [Mariniluteicoccus endophyticus]